MTKLRALLASTLLAGSMAVAVLAATTADDAQAPSSLRDGSSWCC